jgi:MFS transporter
VIGALAAAALLGLAFGAVERRVPEPILPFEAMRDRTVASSLLAMACTGMVMYSAISFVPLFVQGVIGTSATSSGVVLTPLILGITGSSFVSGQWISRSGRTRPNALVGPIVLTAGMVLLWRMTPDTTNGQAARNMVIAGIGVGLMTQVFVISVQNAVPRKVIGAATAMTHFSRSIGATLGVTIMGAIINQGLPAGAPAASETLGVHRLPEHLRVGLAHAMHPAFLALAIVSALVWLIAFVGIREVVLRRTVEDVAAEPLA